MRFGRLWTAFSVVVYLLLAGCGNGGNGGTDTSAPNPIISSLSVSTSSITSGESTILTAIFSNGSGRIDNGGGVVTSAKIVAVAPTATTTYTLTVTNADGVAVTDQVTVTVVPSPSISSFTSSPVVIESGGTSFIVPVFTNGTGSINNGIGIVSSGDSISVSPTNTTTYTLIVTNSLGATDAAQAIVVFAPAPVITSFSASSTTIAQGQSVTLTGVFDNGTGNIDQVAGSLISTLPITVSPTMTTTYILTVANAAGSLVTDQVTVTVVPPPLISSFTSSPAVIETGGSSFIVPVFTNGTGSIDNGIGAVNSGDSINVSPTNTTPYTLTVTNSLGAFVTRQASVIFALAPTITSFSASSTTIAQGQSVMLTGVFENGTGDIDQAVGSLVSTLSKSVSPAATTIYTLTVTNAAGSSVTDNVTVRVITGSYTNTGNLNTARYGHTSTSLPNGQILIVGGLSTDTAELYDPLNGTFSYTGSLNVARSFHTATLLPNGKVLVVGGTNLNNTEIYNPQTGMFTSTGSLSNPVSGHTATLLNNGKVLVVGGNNTAEVYDPLTGLFTATGSLSEARSDHTATQLSSGKVLIVGGSPWTTGVEIYDPDLGTFSNTGPLTYSRIGHTATLLNNGEVLVVGLRTLISPSNPVPKAEIYNETNGTFTLTSPVVNQREFHTATLLLDGNVLLSGGAGETTDPLGNDEIYDVVEGQFYPIPALSQYRREHAASRLSDGRVLVSGGWRFELPAYIDTTELFSQ